MISQKPNGAWPFAEKMERMRAEQQQQLAAIAKIEDSATARELAGLPIVFCATSQDKRIIDLVAHFNRMDPRGRLTLLRMAAVMPGPKESM